MRGQAALEYTLLLGAVAFSAFTAMRAMGLGILHSPGLSAAVGMAQARHEQRAANADPGPRVSGKPHTIILRDEK